MSFCDYIMTFTTGVMTSRASLLCTWCY